MRSDTHPEVYSTLKPPPSLHANPAPSPHGRGERKVSLIRLAVRRGMWHIARRLVLSQGRLWGSRIIEEKPGEDVLDILSRYVEIVARHGFDGIDAAKFRAAHHHNMGFVLRAAAHDRMMMRKSSMEETDRNKGQGDSDRGR